MSDQGPQSDDDYGEINWKKQDTWEQNLSLAKFDHEEAAEIPGKSSETMNVQNVTSNLEDLNKFDDEGFKQYVEKLGESNPAPNETGDVSLEPFLGKLHESNQTADDSLEQYPENPDGSNQGGHEFGHQNLFAMGVQHLRNDARILVLINEHPELPTFDGNDMSGFQQLLRALIEEGGSQTNRANRYAELLRLCDNNINQMTVGLLTIQDLIGIGVQGQKKAEAILNFASDFEDKDDAAIDELLQTDSENLFRQFRLVKGVGPYGALHVLVFGAKRLDFMPIHESNLKRRIRRHYVHANPDYESWNPYQGLAAWLIWTHVKMRAV